ncbi:MAG: hypothetical protein GXY48_03595 [Methanomicrobiales archaeon]|nr:hypothetical protein [Methanomicrobiales archaeon]
MSGRGSDDALSEVIGFILIIGLLVVVMSLYITYVVPSEGRTNEIEQMDYIKQQFLDYKLNTDALWLNNNIGQSITQALTMGTAGQTTTGMFAGFSLVSPIGSSGSVMVNPMERSERMHITAAGVTQNDPSIFTVVDAPIIDKISPGSVNVGSSGPVTLTGSGFSGSDNVEVFFKGSKLDSVVIVSDNEITITVPSQQESGLIHIYVKKPLGVRSNVVYLLITKTSDNPVPEKIVINPDEYFVAGSGGTITITASDADTNSLVLIDNILASYGTSIDTTVSPYDKIFDHPNVIPITVINPPPGGGSSSKKWYVLPSSVNSPEVWGISPEHTSVKSDFSSNLKIYGAGFSSTSTVFWGDQEIACSYVDYNLIEIPLSEFPGEYLNEPGEFQISVRDGKTSGSTQMISGTLIPVTTPYPSSSIPINHFYVEFIDSGYDTQKTHELMTLDQFSKLWYGVELFDEYNNLTIRLEAIPRIISSDWPYDLDPVPTPIPDHPEDDSYYFSYQTDLIMNVNQSDIQIMENYVIASDISKGESIWLDLLNPAYGIIDYLKSPFQFIPSKTGEYADDTKYSFEYTLLSNSHNDTVIIDNALGAFEYNSQNYYYRTQQDFIYQSGGVFVEQVDGSNPLVLPPISVTRNGGNLVVGISNIPVSGYDNIAGSSQVQVSSTLDSIDTYGITTGLPNAKSVILHIDPTTESNRARWYSTIKAICENARSNGVPVAFSKGDSNYKTAWVRIEDDDSDDIPPILNIRGRDNEGLESTYQNTQDIILDLKTPELSVALNPVGKAVSIR